MISEPCQGRIFCVPENLLNIETQQILDSVDDFHSVCGNFSQEQINKSVFKRCSTDVQNDKIALRLTPIAIRLT